MVTKIKSIKKRLDEVEKEVVHKEKKFRIPLKGKIGKRKIKEGWATIVTMNENRNIDFTKQKIIDSTIKLDNKDLSFHAIEPDDVFFHKGKPLVFQYKGKLNPYNPLKGENETYGQRYIMARMEGDTIKMKKSLGMGAGIIGLIIVAAIVYAVFTGGAA
jgi:hypothetical protein